MKPKTMLLALLLTFPAPLCAGDKQGMDSPTEHVIDHRFLGEKELKHRSLDMLSRFMVYAKNIYTDTDKNSQGEECGFFKAKSGGMSNEDGVRTNADMAMVTAFLCHYGPANGIALPEGVSYAELRRMGEKALNYALSTHRSNRLMTCKDGRYWGTMGDQYQWESSLWTLSVTLAAHFLGKTEGKEREMLERMLVAEADYELTRPVPTGYVGDTKAEENGWETNVLACACALLPQHEHAGQWKEAMLRYAFNCYSVAADGKNEKVVAGRKACEWFVGQNLYDDYTLQNHNYFHTSYQNVVMQELAESIVAKRILNGNVDENGNENEVLTWHWQEVWDEVLAPLALCDGELAMPNGNDWSMFLYDQLPAYAAMSTLLHNPDALMLENMALKYVEARQLTTTDGAWMLNPDIGARRMGVTAHRVMMTFLLHELFPTGGLKPSTWSDFQRRHARPKLFESQNIVRAMSEQRFACFSWSEGLGNANCLMVPNVPDRNKIVVPYKKGCGGNLTGHPTGFKLVGKPRFDIGTDTWTVHGQLQKGDSLMRFTIHDDGANELRLDYQGADGSIGLLAISVDPLTSTRRTLYFEGDSLVTNGEGRHEIRSPWVNIDNEIGVICLNDDNRMLFGCRELVNSIYTAKLYPQADNTADKHGTVFYYVNQTAEETRRMYVTKTKLEQAKLATPHKKD